MRAEPQDHKQRKLFEPAKAGDSASTYPLPPVPRAQYSLVVLILGLREALRAEPQDRKQRKLFEPATAGDSALMNISCRPFHGLKNFSYR